jgi:hypothetical protein
VLNLLPVKELETIDPVELDSEWVELVLEAKRLGLTSKQVSAFLSDQKPEIK